MLRHDLPSTFMRIFDPFTQTYIGPGGLLKVIRSSPLPYLKKCRDSYPESVPAPPQFGPGVAAKHLIIDGGGMALGQEGNMRASDCTCVEKAAAPRPTQTATIFRPNHIPT